MRSRIAISALAVACGAAPPAAVPHARLVPRAADDAPVRRVQAGSVDMPAFPTAGLPGDAATVPVAEGGQSISLQAALYGAYTCIKR